MDLGRLVSTSVAMSLKTLLEELCRFLVQQDNVLLRVIQHLDRASVDTDAQRWPPEHEVAVHFDGCFCFVGTRIRNAGTTAIHRVLHANGTKRIRNGFKSMGGTSKFATEQAVMNTCKELYRTPTDTSKKQQTRSHTARPSAQNHMYIIRQVL